MPSLLMQTFMKGSASIARGAPGECLYKTWGRHTHEVALYYLLSYSGFYCCYERLLLEGSHWVTEQCQKLQKSNLKKGKEKEGTILAQVRERQSGSLREGKGRNGFQKELKFR